MLEGLIDDLQNFGMCGDEFFVIDQIRAVDIVNAVGKLEEERDRLKKTIAIMDGNLTASMKEIMGRNIELLNAQNRLQARDHALDKAKDNFIKIRRQCGDHGFRPGFQTIGNYANESLRAIEVTKAGE